MNILIDMNLSPRWVEMLNNAGHHATHWISVGDKGAPDTVLMGPCTLPQLHCPDRRS